METHEIFPQRANIVFVKILDAENLEVRIWERGAGETANAEIILGILSLIIWALILVVTVKYVLLLLRADNDGEGGTLALMAEN